MGDPVFFHRQGPYSVAEIAEWTGSEIAGRGDNGLKIENVLPLNEAGPTDLAFIDNPAYVTQLERTKAGAIIANPKFADHAPKSATLLINREPQRAMAITLARFFPEAGRSLGAYGRGGGAAAATVHETARLEENVTVEPGAVIGEGCEIGSGTLISAGAVIGQQVRIGRDCYIGPGVTVLHALIGNRVILHPGVCVGQDGFGYASSRSGHMKMPQVGRVIIQDDVEIGANSAVDRGATRDTIVGEGTKIDNLVQIGHNVRIGRHCVIVALTGIAGSAEIGDFVAIGGQVGVIGHIKIGDGAQIAASSRVRETVPPGERWGGTPAKPVREWFREMTALKKLGATYGRNKKEEDQ